MSDHAHLTVLLADAGGRELGGLPLSLQVPGGPSLLDGRIGARLQVPAGPIRITLPLSLPVVRELSLAPGEDRRLDLGRLGSLLVSLSRRSGQVTHGAPLTLTAVPGGDAIHGRVGAELQLWPGRWRVAVQAAGDLAAPAPVEVEVAPGALVELELGESPTRQSARVLAREVTGALRTVRRRLGMAPPAASSPLRDPSRGPGVFLADAHGRPTRRAVVLEGASRLHVWTGDAAAVPAGPWLARLSEGGEGWHVQVDPQGRVDLGALGAVEVHLKDPEGVSLRFAPLVAEGRDGRWEGQVGIPLELTPGRYALRLPTLPGYDREVVVEAGEITRLDLGVASALAIPAAAAEGVQVIEIHRADAPPGTPPLFRGRAREELLVPSGRYRVDVGEPPRPGEVIEARGRRKRKPEVAARFLGDAPAGA